MVFDYGLLQNEKPFKAFINLNFNEIGFFNLCLVGNDVLVENISHWYWDNFALNLYIHIIIVTPNHFKFVVY